MSPCHTLLQSIGLTWVPVWGEKQDKNSVNSIQIENISYNRENHVQVASEPKSFINTHTQYRGSKICAFKKG